MEVKAEYLAIFREEASDQLREWEESLLALDKFPGQKEPLNNMFRAIHTLKGSAGFIGFDTLQKLAHDLESLLSAVRDGDRQYDGTLGDLMFKGLDLARSLIDAFADGHESQEDVEGFLARLTDWPGSPGAGKEPVVADPFQAPKTSVGAPAPDVSSRKCAFTIRIEGQNREAYLRSCLVKARLDRLGTVLDMQPPTEVLRDSSEPFVYKVTMSAEGDPAALARSISIDQVSVVPAVVETAEQSVKGEDSPGPSAGEQRLDTSRGSQPEEVVRVSVQKLDTLLNLVGELVIHNSGFLSATQLLKEQYGKSRITHDLEEKTETLSAITRDLQDGIMKARMLPIANVFNRFRRVVRDLAKASGKSVILEIFGEETEIDKKVIDRIGEPLVHLVRNAVDHGLEPSADRSAAGKPGAGTIRLGAYQEGDHICIEVTDDGKGLDRDAILRKALEKGLVSAEDVPNASTEKILGFIFLPGFSTARSVSDISGRGVGMDAVKRAVDEMNGNVRVRSTPGAGTTVTISLPLTMAIITAVLVEASGSTYAIPLSAVREIVKTTALSLRSVGGRRVISLRNEILALANLAATLNQNRDALGESSDASRTSVDVSDASREGTRSGRPVIVVDFEGRRIGLEVDKIIGSREVVIKSLSRHYREVEGLIGASILGNGNIALIVDVETMIGQHQAGGIGTGPSGAPVVKEIVAEAGGLIRSVTAGVSPSESSRSEDAAREDVPAEGSIEQLAREVTGAKGRLLEDVNNQGAIQASMSLTQLTGHEIRVSFPESRLVPIRDIAEIMGGEESTVGGMYVGVQGDLAAGMLLVIPERSLLDLDDLLHGRPAGSSRELKDVDLSGISEVGNILASCFVNAIADETRLTLSPEVPEISVDMCLPVIDSVLGRFNQPGDKLLITDAIIYGSGSGNVVCHQVLLLEPDSLRKLMDALEATVAAAQVPSLMATAEMSSGIAG